MGGGIALWNSWSIQDVVQLSELQEIEGNHPPSPIDPELEGLLTPFLKNSFTGHFSDQEGAKEVFCQKLAKLALLHIKRKDKDGIFKKYFSNEKVRDWALHLVKRYPSPLIQSFTSENIAQTRSDLITKYADYIEDVFTYLTEDEPNLQNKRFKSDQVSLNQNRKEEIDKWTKFYTDRLNPQHVQDPLSELIAHSLATATVEMVDEMLQPEAIKRSFNDLITNLEDKTPVSHSEVKELLSKEEISALSRVTKSFLKHAGGVNSLTEYALSFFYPAQIAHITNKKLGRFFSIGGGKQKFDLGLVGNIVDVQIDKLQNPSIQDKNLVDDRDPLTRNIKVVGVSEMGDWAVGFSNGVKWLYKAMIREPDVFRHLIYKSIETALTI
ncbi:MAG: hypothetical protein JSR80_07380 [Verrucomicrobia bacterium]|nr:hypothetical protein [Verrucomicrobiota bacterium]